MRILRYVILLVVVAIIAFLVYRFLLLKPHWGYPNNQDVNKFKKDTCSSAMLGYRQYSAILWDIPFGKSWETTCRETSADVNGVHFDSPTRCVNTVTNMWGEFDVPDNSCYPHWGEFKRDNCSTKTLGVRQYSAILWDIPTDYSWEAACAQTPADVKGVHFDSPTRCVNTVINMWGEFDVPDNSCYPHWGEFKRDNCSTKTLGVRQYSAILWDIPTGYSWEAACAQTSADVEGVHFDSPTRCVNTVTNMWGEFDVPDNSCYPHWGEFKRDHCTRSGFRQYSAILWDIPTDYSWEAACAQTPADVKGVHFDSPTRCVNTVTNMWGEFDVPDSSCQ